MDEHIYVRGRFDGENVICIDFDLACFVRLLSVPPDHSDSQR